MSIGFCPRNPPRLPLASLGVIAASAAAGLALFRRKDLK